MKALAFCTRSNIAECHSSLFSVFQLLDAPLERCVPERILKTRLVPIAANVDLKKHFLSPPYSLSVEVGRSAELRCSPPLGVPPPKVYWLRNGSPLETSAAGTASASSDANPNEMSSADGFVQSADGFVQSADGHLLLGEAELRHQGNYSCVAENLAARRVSEPAVLTVYGEQFSFTDRRTDAVEKRLRSIIEEVDGDKAAKKSAVSH